MKAIILAAGYATRLYPLTLNTPKALLPINDKPIINYIVSQIETLDDVTDIYVVTNHKFYDHFVKWESENKFEKPVSILDDLTTNEDNRKGAIGDILFTINEKNIDDELLIIAGDNFFTYKIKDFYDYFKSKDGDCVCVSKIDDVETLKQFGVASLDENNKVVEIEEKPENPKSDIGVYATYLYKKNTVKLFEKYISDGNMPDAPGYFTEWLYKISDVYGYIFDGECYDIGTQKSYKDVCDAFS